MTLPPVDPVRLQEEWAADQAVLADLLANGDRPDLPRPIDVSFNGSAEALDRLADAAGDHGFEVLESEPGEDGGMTLFLEIEQAADEASIRQLTITCLQIEAVFGVEYDGWGCQAQDGGDC